MKKSLTVFAAAAMLATFAGVVMAATPTINMSGGMVWSVEYNLLTKNWDSKATSALNNGNSMSFTVTTAGNPAISVTHWYPGMTTTGVMTGTLAGANVALGSVGSGYAWTALSGDGATVSKTFGNATFSAINAGSNNGAKVAVDLGNGNSVFGSLAVNPEFNGLAVVGGNYGLGQLSLAGKAAMETGEKDGGKMFYVTANSSLVEGFSLNGAIAKVDGITNQTLFVDQSNPWWEDWTSSYVLTNTPKMQADGFNFKLAGNLTVIKDVATVGAEYARYADKSNYVKVSASNSDICLSNAYAKFNSDKSNVYGATFSKTVAGVGLTAEASLTTTATTNSTWAKLTATKSFEWLSTWASVEKSGDVVTPKIGAKASVAW